MRNRKIIVSILMLIFVLMLAGCTKTVEPAVEEVSEVPAVEETVVDEVDSEVAEEPAEEIAPEIEMPEMSIGTLAGPTGIGMIQLIENMETGVSSVNGDITISSDPTELTAKLISGELDFACVPTNLASTLYNKTEGNVILAAVNTLGVIYIMEDGTTINEISDLAGADVYSSSQGSLPDYVLQYILAENGVEGVNVDFSMSHADVASTLIAGDVNVALLPQPYVTTSQMKSETVRIAIDLNEEWKALQGEDSSLPMGAIVVNKEFAEANPEAVEIFLNEYKASVEWVNANVDEASVLVEKHGIIPSAAIAKAAIPFCNIVYIDAVDASDMLNGLYQVLYNFEPKSIGGAIPGEDFYYQK